MTKKAMNEIFAMLLYPRVGQPVRDKHGHTGHIEVVRDGVATIRWDDGDWGVVPVSSLTDTL